MSLSGLAEQPGADAHVHAAGLRSGGETILDLDYRPAFWDSERAAADAARSLWGRATVLIGNLAECRIATGATGADAAADALLATGARLAIVKLGEDGVLAATAGRRLTVAPIPVRVANGLGSGDAFGGALCHGLLGGWDLDRTIAFANAAGALVATRRGCSTAMPTAPEVEALLAGATSRPA
jgi:5-dehydro-2-deoxygluconokinase